MQCMSLRGLVKMVTKRLLIVLLTLFLFGLLTSCQEKKSEVPSETEVSATTDFGGETQLGGKTEMPVSTTKDYLKHPLQPVYLSKAGQIRLEEPEVLPQIILIGSREELEHQSFADDEQLTSYDEAFFEDKGLIFATFNARSGSTIVDFREVQRSDMDVTVALYGHYEGMGTMDLAAFVIWAEIPKEWLEFSWHLENSLGYAEK